MILGNYMLLNLFLAILLKFISENSDHEKAHEEGAEGHCDDGEDMNKSAMKDDKKDPNASEMKKDGLDGQDINGS